jgi:hypothetical protein
MAAALITAGSPAFAPTVPRGAPPFATEEMRSRRTEAGPHCPSATAGATSSFGRRKLLGRAGEGASSSSFEGVQELDRGGAEPDGVLR